MDFILGYASRRDRAWDCATGNGQVAVALSKHFKQVAASDVSQAQLDNAVKAPNIEYFFLFLVGGAEVSGAARGGSDSGDQQKSACISPYGHVRCGCNKTIIFHDRQ
jgi:hypothetical protein